MQNNGTARIGSALAATGIELHFPTIEGETYRVTRTRTSQCKLACPVDVNVKAYMGLIAVGKFEKALEVIKRTNPLPGICGRVCFHPCEKECHRKDIDRSVAICALKRFVADHDLNLGKAPPVAPPRTREEKVAIVGSGPCGLTAASDLARRGYSVTVFEALPVAGGLLAVGIPAYRMPRQVVQSEIDAILAEGVEIRANTRVGKDVTLEELEQQGYKAFLLAVGAHKSLKTGLEGEDLKGVLNGLEFSKSVGLGGTKPPGKKVVVVGGGNVAVSCARSALRLSCESVTLVYSRPKEDMPAYEHEVEEAEAEGVEVHCMTGVRRILGSRKRVRGVECVQLALSESDAVGRRRSTPIAGMEFTLEADAAILAAAQETDFSFLSTGSCGQDNHGFSVSRWGAFAVDPLTLTTNKPGYFAAGDAVSGPKSVIEAMAGGRRAAIAIDCYLSGRQAQPEDFALHETEEETEILVAPVTPRERVGRRTLPPQVARESFAEMDLGMTPAEAMAEAQRCMMCGPCHECVECVPTCDKKMVVVNTEPNATEPMLLRVRSDFTRKLLGSDLSPGVMAWERQSFFIPAGDTAVTVHPTTCEVDEFLCRACGTCEQLCPYSAIHVANRGGGMFAARSDISLCKGCGTCAAHCPTHAIKAGYSMEKGLRVKG